MKRDGGLTSASSPYTADVWRTAGRPYEQALALVEVGSPTALAEAFDILDRLGASGGHARRRTVAVIG
jgi:hypothetical protein